jgi:hypothetical protein
MLLLMIKEYSDASQCSAFYWGVSYTVTNSELPEHRHLTILFANSRSAFAWIYMGSLL